MGKKYIIEIPDDKVGDFVGSTHFIMPYMMAGHIGHHDTGLPIKPYTEPDVEQVRKEAYQKGYEQGYKDGYNEPGKGKIQVGDEVKLKCGVSPAIYMQGTNGSDEIYLLFNDGSCGIHGRDEIECKTGRHFPEIAEVLQKMKES